MEKYHDEEMCRKLRFCISGSLICIPSLAEFGMSHVVLQIFAVTWRLLKAA